MAEERQEKDRWLDAITHMIELTQQGKLDWRLAYVSEMPGSDAIKAAVLISEFNNKKLRLFTKRVELPPPDPISEAWYETVNRTPPPKSRLVTVLEFIDDQGATLWTFPSVSALEDLLRAAQYQAAGVNDFLAEIEALAS